MGFFTDTALGRWIFTGISALGFLAIAAWRLIALGAERQRAKDAETRLDAVRQRKEVDDEVGKLDDSATTSQLRGWMRD